MRPRRTSSTSTSPTIHSCPFIASRRLAAPIAFHDVLLLVKAGRMRRSREGEGVVKKRGLTEEEERPRLRSTYPIGLHPRLLFFSRGGWPGFASQPEPFFWGRRSASMAPIRALFPPGERQGGSAVGEHGYQWSLSRWRLSRRTLTAAFRGLRSCSAVGHQIVGLLSTALDLIGPMKLIKSRCLLFFFLQHAVFSWWEALSFYIHVFVLIGKDGRYGRLFILGCDRGADYLGVMLRVINGELRLVTGRVHKHRVLGGRVVREPGILRYRLLGVGRHGQPDRERKKTRLVDACEVLKLADLVVASMLADRCSFQMGSRFIQEMDEVTRPRRGIADSLCACYWRRHRRARWRMRWRCGHMCCSGQWQGVSPHPLPSATIVWLMYGDLSLHQMYRLIGFAASFRSARLCQA